jgi:hypothetical protein
MAVIECKITVPRRQAMLSITEPVYKDSLGDKICVGQEEIARVPVFVWPMPTQDGCFVVEHLDGRCQKVEPDELTFLGSEELFDQYYWSEHD